MVGSQEVAGLVGRSVQYTDTTLLGAGPVGAGELGHQEDMFPFKYIFELFMFYSYFLTPWFFADSRISRQRLAESFVGHGRDCG